MKHIRNNQAFTLIELVIIILVLGVISAVAIGRLNEGLETAQIEHTKTEMDAISVAIIGNPELYSGGARTSFGYVGDVGALPPTLSALVIDPGLGTWNGPYLSAGGVSNDYSRDAWGTAYTFAGISVTSTGSGSPMVRTIAQNSAVLLTNIVQGTVSDADGETPGMIYADSISVLLTYPDGAGGMQIAANNPNRSGLFSFNSVPMGNHRLSLIYDPTGDSTIYQVTVLPGRTTTLQINLDADLW